MPPIDHQRVARKFVAALPGLRDWIDTIVRLHRAHAQSLETAGYDELRPHFPVELLRATNVVLVNVVPFPRLAAFGLHELADLEAMPLAGITYGDTFFVQALQRSPSLYFHELVHVVQWGRLGMDRFMLAYGMGLMLYGYEHSPLERMAYGMQDRFDRGDVPADLVERIEKETDAVWSSVAPLFADVS